MTDEPKPDDKKFYNKNRNDVTGDRLTTKVPSEEFKSNYDKIKWSNGKESTANYGND